MLAKLANAVTNGYCAPQPVKSTGTGVFLKRKWARSKSSATNHAWIKREEKMYPYIENPAVARAIADNEADWAYTYAKEAQEEADKEEAERLAKKYGLQILMEWVWADEAEYTREEYQDAYTQEVFDDFVYCVLDENKERPLPLGIEMPNYNKYLALRTVRMAA
nr:MAG TPA: hypothetical protein [Caudoviricetes sp.]